MVRHLSDEEGAPLLARDVRHASTAACNPDGTIPADDLPARLERLSA